MGDGEVWDWVRPPADWTDIPDWDLATSAHDEAVRMDERHRTMQYIEYFGGDEFEVGEFWASTREADMGLRWAEAEWRALSEAQRHGLAREHAGLRGRLTVATRRALVRRELMDDKGLTEKGRFVLLEGIT